MIIRAGARQAFLVLLVSILVFGQARTTPPAPGQNERADAYYNYAMAHLYSELAQQYGNRAEYINKAIEHYRLAIKADPASAFLSEELTDLYIQGGQIRSAVQEQEEAIKKNPRDLTARRILARLYSRMLGDPNQNRINETMLKNAVEQYSRIVEIDPKDADSWSMLGRLHQISNNSVEAEKAFQKSIEIEPDNEDALTGLALVYSNLGDHKKSTDLLEKVAAKSPGMRTLLALAQGYEQMRDFKLASETLKKAVTMSPGNSEVRRALAQTLIYAEKYDEALKEYQELVEDDPRDSASWLRVSQIYRQQRKMKEAREAADKAKSLDGNNLEVRYNDANLLEAEGKVAEGIAVIKEMLSSTSKRNYSPMEKQYRAQLLDRLGQMNRTIEQPAEAVKAFREMAEMDPENAARASAQVIETWRLARDYPKAVEEADAAVKKYPQDRMVKLIRANLLADTGKTNEAATEIKGLLDGKNDRETWMSLAQIYEKGKNFGEMAKAVDAAEKLSESDEEKEGVWFMRGAMFERQKKHEQAEAEFRKILKANPNNAGALNYLGYMLADRNVRLNEALDLIQKALEKDPGNGAYLDSLGWVYFRLDRLKDAETQLQSAIEKVPTDPTVRDHLGDVYAKQGRLKDAVDQWQSSLAQWKQSAPADVDSNEVAKVQKKLDNAKVRLAKEGPSPKKP